jgi:hypothetical protein
VSRVEEPLIRFLRRVSLAVYLIEAGVVLAIAPWTELWQRNYFVARWPWTGSWMHSMAAQWLVIGIGVVTAAAGMTDLRAVIAGRFARPSAAGEGSGSRRPGPPVP